MSDDGAAMAERLRPEWLDAYTAYMEQLDAEFESYESSIHQDGFGAGWTAGQEAAEAEVARLQMALSDIQFDLINCSQAAGRNACVHMKDATKIVNVALAGQDGGTEVMPDDR